MGNLVDPTWRVFVDLFSFESGLNGCISDRMQQDHPTSEIANVLGDTLEHMDARRDETDSQTVQRHGSGLSNSVAPQIVAFNFSCLPRVIFLTILQFFETVELCRLCLVCKLWRKVCQDPSLWRNLDLRKFHNIKDGDLGRLTSLSNNVISLKIDQADLLTNDGVISVLTNCTSLQELTLNHCYNLSDQVLEAVGEHCHHLKKLDISLSIYFSDYGVRRVCQGCLELEELITDQCAKLTSDSLVSLGNHCAKLKSISTERVANIEDNGLISFVQGCPHLQSLRVPFCGLTNQCLPYIMECCPDIYWLDLRGIALADGDVCTLVQSCAKVVYLNLSLCYNLTDRAALEIGMKCKSIKYLFLVHNKVTDNGLLQLGRHCKSLEHLDVSWCSGVTADGAKNILIGCPKLRHLGLVRCDHVSESAVSELSLSYPNVYVSTAGTEMKKFLNDTAQFEGRVFEKTNA